MQNPIPQFRQCSLIRETTIMFIIFWDLISWWLIKVPFHHKRNEAWLLVINWYIRVPSRVAEQVRLIYQEISGKSQNFMKLLPSAQPPSRNENFVSTSKSLLKNRNSTFPIVRYFTWKLEFVSNILWMMAAYFTEKLEILTSSNYRRVWLFLLKFYTCFLLKRVRIFFLFCVDLEI